MAGRSLSLILLSAALMAGCAHSATQAANGTVRTARAPLGDGSRGADVFRANCAVCHAATGAAGGIGPSLVNEMQRKNYDQTVAWIEQPDPPMPKLYPSPLSEKDVQDVAAYVQSL